MHLTEGLAALCDLDKPPGNVSADVGDRRGRDLPAGDCANQEPSGPAALCDGARAESFEHGVPVSVECVRLRALDLGAPFVRATVPLWPESRRLRPFSDEDTDDALP